MLMSMRGLALFLITLLVVTWALQIAGLILVGDPSDSAMMPFLIAAMFMPALWSVAYLTLFNRKAWRLVRFWPGNPLYLLLGALIPAAIGFGVLAISLQQGWGGSDYFSFGDTGAEVLRGPWVLGDGAQNWALFVANIALTALIFAAINGTAAAGEEFGWRGVLQHHMIARFGYLRGVTLLGFIWAMWHLPMNLAGYNYTDAPALGALVLFPIQLIGASFIMAWLTIRAKSFWPAVMMHGSTNGILEGLMQSMIRNAEIAPMAIEYAKLAVLVAVALICAIWRPRAPAS